MVIKRSIKLDSITTGQCRTHAGIHLSGANTPKTTLVLLRGDLSQGPLIIDRVYEKIGSFGSLFSDDRLIDIISHLGEMDGMFVDCPLTLPPCASCVLEVCPGVASCDDLSVAYMMSIGARIKGSKGKRKRRPVNPQSHRLWDLMQSLETSKLPKDSSFNSNMIPLVIRGRTLAKRLNSLSTPLQLRETSVPQILSVLSPYLNFESADIAQKYRRFEGGLEIREAIVDSMIEAGWLETWVSSNHETYLKVVRSVENFQALLTAWVSALFDCGQTTNRPKDFISSEGWVYLPNLVTDSNNLPTSVKSPHFW